MTAIVMQMISSRKRKKEEKPKRLVLRTLTIWHSADSYRTNLCSNMFPGLFCVESCAVGPEWEILTGTEEDPHGGGTGEQGGGDSKERSGFLLVLARRRDLALIFNTHFDF